MNHEYFMHHCLLLASKGRGKVGNGAMVGACLVRDGNIIAEGWHRGWGKVHAERDLLERLSDQKISSTDTLYVNLEPCCHHGKTPPCTDIIISSGVRRVVYGMKDPDKRVAGQGIAILKSAGLEVRGPVLPELCRRFNRGFVSVRTKDRPWITAKMAFDGDRSIANPDGSPKSITSDKQNAWSHASLRGTHDAILVGVNTVMMDNPGLTNRAEKLYKKCDQIFEIRPYLSQIPPLVFILDSRLRTPVDALVIREGTTIFYDQQYKDEKVEQILCSKGVRTTGVPRNEKGFDLEWLFQHLITPARDYHGITSLLVEGGLKTRETFFDAGVVDEDIVLTA